jgi:hypothetical protein
LRSLWARPCGSHAGAVRSPSAVHSSPERFCRGGFCESTAIGVLNCEETLPAATLVNKNLAHFQRISGLSVTQWS